MPITASAIAIILLLIILIYVRFFKNLLKKNLEKREINTNLIGLKILMKP